MLFLFFSNHFVFVVEIVLFVSILFNLVASVFQFRTQYASIETNNILYGH